MNNKILIPFSIVIAGIIIGVAILYSNYSGKQPAQVTQGATTIQIDTSKREILGDKNAKVEWIEFSDYQCPFCGKLTNGVRKEILEKYVKTGKVKMIFKNFAFLGEESLWAAEAAECSREQGKYWEYHDLLFAKQSGENQGTFKKDNLRKWAEELGLDKAKFNDCLDSEKYRSLIQSDYDEGVKIGVQGTPTVFINGEKIVGALPIVKYVEVIEKYLKD